MAKDLEILIAVEDEGYVTLLKRNLQRVGITNKIRLFKDGENILNFMLRQGPGPHRNSSTDYVLLLDTRIPKVDGIEVLRQIKQDDEIGETPVIMLSTADDHEEMAQCHTLGCCVYLKKQVDFTILSRSIKEAGIVTPS